MRRIPLSELSISRIGSAIRRRTLNFPHLLSWYRPRNAHKRQALTNLRGKHTGERCFIMGNGPSLAQMNLQPLRNSKTFGFNRIYLHFDRMGFEPTYYVSINELVLEQSWQEIVQIANPKFINWRKRGLFNQKQGIYFLLERFSPHFSTDIQEGFWGGATVTFAALQIAYHMGFSEIILIGVDHNFKVDGTPHKVVSAGSIDHDHFHPKYFADGTRWQLPDLTTSEYAFQLAREAYENDGRSIVDATLDGKLQVFPKIDFEELLKEM